MRQFGRAARWLVGSACIVALGASLVAVGFFHRVLERTEGEVAALRREAARQAHAGAERSAQDRAQLEQVGRELAQSSAEREHALAEIEVQAQIVAGQQDHIEQLKAESDTAVELAAEQARLLVDRRAMLEEAASERTQLARERDRALTERDAMVNETRGALRELDAETRTTMADVEKTAASERTELARERDRALAERDAMVNETRRALRELDAETRTTMADVEKIIVATGLEPSRVVPEPNRIRRVGARGGPYIPWKAQVTLAEHAESVQLHTLTQQLERLKSLRDVMVRLPLVAPVTHAILSDGFGYRRDPVTGGGSRHDGLDLRAVRDSAIIAPAAGTVIAAGWDGAFGNLIQIDHGFGVVSRYAHLSRMLVRKGDVVAPGEQIGVVGATGRVTGTHLHYEIWMDGQPRDPIRFITAVSRPFAGFGRQ